MLQEQFASILPVTQSSINDQVVLTVDARQLHNALQIQDHFATWVSRATEAAGLELGLDYFEASAEVDVELTQNRVSSTPSQNSRTRKDFYFTLDAAKHISMMTRNEVGRAIRNYFIECEKQLRAEPVTPSDYPAALRALAESYEREQAAKAQLSQTAIQLDQARSELASSQEEAEALLKVLSLPDSPFLGLDDPLSEHYCTIGQIFKDSVPFSKRIKYGKSLMAVFDKLRPLARGTGLEKLLPTEYWVRSSMLGSLLQHRYWIYIVQALVRNKHEMLGFAPEDFRPEFLKVMDDYARELSIFLETVVKKELAAFRPKQLDKSN